MAYAMLQDSFAVFIAMSTEEEEQQQQQQFDDDDDRTALVLPQHGSELGGMTNLPLARRNKDDAQKKKKNRDEQRAARERAWYEMKQVYLPQMREEAAARKQPGERDLALRECEMVERIVSSISLDTPSEVLNMYALLMKLRIFTASS